MTTFLLLLLSNVFMTFAWYGHLKRTDVPLWQAILFSWGIAFFEYCLMVPANRIGHQGGMSGYQLKVLQEGITLGVFIVFALLYLKEKPSWNYMVAFALIFAAVLITFRKPGNKESNPPPVPELRTVEPTK